MSPCDIVRNHFKAMQVSSCPVCADMTGLEPAAVCEAMKQLIREKRIEQIKDVPGLYSYKQKIAGGAPRPVKPPPQATEEQRKLWWAMHIPHNRPAPFTVFGLAQLAGVTEPEARFYVRYLARKKIVQCSTHAGRSRNHKYRVLPGAPAADNPPIYKPLNLKEKR